MRYESSDLTHLLIDLDDTIYPPNIGIWNQISERMIRYLIDFIGVPPEEAHALRRRLFTTYGTTLRGLQIEKNVDMRHYLNYVHDIDLTALRKPAVELRQVLSRIQQPKWILTNASLGHAERVLAGLELRDLFEGIIDITMLNPWCKPNPEAFQIALTLCGNPAPERCLFIDDSVPNVDSALGLNLKTVLVSDKASLFHPTINRLEQLEEVLQVE